MAPSFGCSSKFCTKEKGGSVRKKRRGVPEEKKTTVRRRCSVSKARSWRDAAERKGRREAAASESERAGKRRSGGRTPGTEACGLVGRSDPEEWAGRVGTASEAGTTRRRSVRTRLTKTRKATPNLADERRSAQHDGAGRGNRSGVRARSFSPWIRNGDGRPVT